MLLFMHLLLYDPPKGVLEVALLCCIGCTNHCPLHIRKLFHPPSLLNFQSNHKLFVGLSAPATKPMRD